MSENAKRLANRKTRSETGLDYVVGALNLLTPFGTRIIKEQKPFFPGQEEELRAELERVQRMLDIAAANERDISVLQETFMMMKDNAFTIERSANAALTVVEIFEIKSLLLLIRCFAAVAANASAVYPGRLPRGEYADTEATTNVPFAFGQLGARNFQFELSLAATPGIRRSTIC